MNMKILCLGNNTEDTDIKTKELAKTTGASCHGLISELDSALPVFDQLLPGYYHSSVYDIPQSKLKTFADQFDLVIMLDQPKMQWSHPHAFLHTVNLVASLTTKTQFLNEEFYQSINYIKNLVEKNLSFCILPFIHLHTQFDSAVLCCRSSKPLTKLSEIKSFATDPAYNSVREKMINGELLWDYCKHCYTVEANGIYSDRKSETIEWANRLNINSIDDLKQISKPAFYDIRPSNKCNLQCRMCNPGDSHLIQQEYHDLSLVPKIDHNELDRRYHGFDIIEYNNLKQVLIAGGEPTIMPELYQWLDQCIETNQTDFSIELTTNGTKVSERLLGLVSKFNDFNFVLSIDGYQDLNHYIRWPSRWEKIVANWKKLKKYANNVTVNVTISIYNVSRLSELFIFIDREFPNTYIHCMLCQNPKLMLPTLYPFADLALEDLQKVTNTDCYRNNRILANSIDSLINQFQNHQLDLSALCKFFEFNDKLDQNRHISLKDYLPELDNYRSIVYNQHHDSN